MSILSPATQDLIEEKLIKDGLITAEEIKALKSDAERSHQPVLKLLMAEGHITDEELTKILAEANKVPYVNLSEAYVEPKVLELLPRSIAENYMAVPLGEMQNRLVVAMLDAGNVQAVDFLSNKVGRPLKIYAASESGIRHVLGQYKQFIDRGVSSLLDIDKPVLDAVQGLTEDFAPVGAADRRVQVIVEDSPVSKALKAILEFAAKNRASDVHIESMENEIKIRCRVDGVLREIMRLPKS